MPHDRDLRICTNVPDTEVGIRVDCRYRSNTSSAESWHGNAVCHLPPFPSREIWPQCPVIYVFRLGIHVDLAVLQ